MKTIAITSPQQKLYALSMVGEMPVDGSREVVFKKVDMSSTAKQRRLRYMWADEIARSGIGAHDTKEGVILGIKWQFGRPIMLRDDELFGIIFKYFMETVKTREDFSECCRAFASQYISIENMTKRQQWELLTDVEMYYSRKGVSLTDPRDCGLDREKLAKMYAK